MNKYNREVDETRINQAKNRAISYVLENVEAKHSIFSIFKRRNIRYALSFMSVVLVVIVGFSLLFNSGDSNYNPNVPTATTLSNYEQQKLVETSYISGNIIINSLGNSIQQLTLTQGSTKFDTKADEFNYYFNMLKPFIDDQDFSDFQVVELENSEYQLEINYLIGKKNYVFRLAIEDSIISGELVVGDITLIVSGVIYKTDLEIELELLASSGADYIKVEYKSEIEVEESEKTYQIEQFINSEYIEKEVKISFEADEVKVEITEGNNEYLLEKIIETDSYYYYLEYEIDDVKGEAYITEELINNKYVYNYHIEEDGIEKDIELDDYEDDEDDEDEEDNEDKDDEDTDDEKDENSETEETTDSEDSIEAEDTTEVEEDTELEEDEEDDSKEE